MLDRWTKEDLFEKACNTAWRALHATTLLQRLSSFNRVLPTFELSSRRGREAS